MTAKRITRIAAWTVVVFFTIGIGTLRFVSWKTKQSEDVVLPTGVPVNTCVLDERYREKIEAARKQIQGILAERGTPSIAIAVSVNGKMIWSEANGYSDQEGKVAATCSTMYRINSVSKLLTAATGARMYEQQTFSWDTDVRRYVPEFPDKGRVITARHLATHTSGIRGYKDDNEAVQTRNFPTVVSSLEMFKEDPLIFEPGQHFLYSGFGYVLLSAALERASGETFTDLVHREVFDVLDMRHSAAATKHHVLEPVYYDNVTPYSTDGSMVISPPNDFSFKMAAAGFLSTPEDLVRFGNAHISSLERGFLNGRSIDMLWEPHGSPVPGFGYGLGWMSAIDPDLREVHFQFGAGSGGTSVLVVYPGQEICFAILSNLGHARFPMDRLLNIADGFQYSPTRIVFNLWIGMLAGLAAYKIFRILRIKRGI
ncbi:MAG TPA: serine hydrolase domain-containing protein [Chryseosolibacter sp.]|nr:serine hydrolase domain-containing protein [Chryseosolibacter sp.]